MSQSLISSVKTTEKKAIEKPPVFLSFGEPEEDKPLLDNAQGGKILTEKSLSEMIRLFKHIEGLKIGKSRKLKLYNALIKEVRGALNKLMGVKRRTSKKVVEGAVIDESINSLKPDKGQYVAKARLPSLLNPLEHDRVGSRIAVDAQAKPAIPITLTQPDKTTVETLQKTKQETDKQMKENTEKFMKLIEDSTAEHKKNYEQLKQLMYVEGQKVFDRIDNVVDNMQKQLESTRLSLITSLSVDEESGPIVEEVDDFIESESRLLDLNGEKAKVEEEEKAVILLIQEKEKDVVDGGDEIKEELEQLKEKAKEIEEKKNVIATELIKAEEIVKEKRDTIKQTMKAREERQRLRAESIEKMESRFDDLKDETYKGEPIIDSAIIKSYETSRISVQSKADYLDIVAKIFSGDYDEDIIEKYRKKYFNKRKFQNIISVPQRLSAKFEEDMTNLKMMYRDIDKAQKKKDES